MRARLSFREAGQLEVGQVKVLLVKAYNRETSPNIGLDLNCLYWKHGCRTLVLVYNVHDHVLATAPVTLRWKCFSTRAFDLNDFI